MFKSRGRKIFRDVWARKGRTALASLSIFIGVLGVVTLLSVGDILVRQLREDIKPDELPMLQVILSLPSGAQVDNAAYIQTLEALPGVTRVEGRASRPLYWRRPQDAKFDDGFMVAAWEPFEKMTLQPLRLTAQGRYPVAGNNEIAIEKRMADRYKLEVGDQLVLRILSGGGMQEQAWTIVGILFQPYTSFFLDADNETSVFAAYEDAQYIAGFTGLDAFYVRYTDYATAKDQSNKFVETLSQETPYVSVFNFMEDPAKSSLIEGVQTITTLLSILGAVAMVVSGFLVTNIINNIVVEQKRQIGVMKSMGATRWDNLVMYIGVALAYGLIGLTPAVLLGVPLGSMLAATIAPMANTLIEGFNVSVLSVLVGVVMGLVVPLLAAVIPVVMGTRVSILDAMTDLGISGDYGKGISARLIGVLPLPINVRQALSNLTRKKARLTLTGITLTLAVASFMGIFGVFYSVNELISDIFGSFGFEIQIVPSEGQEFEPLQALVDEVEGVRAVHPGVGVSVRLEGYENPMTRRSSLQVLGFDPRSSPFDMDYEAGTGWDDDPEREGIVLTSGVAKGVDKGVGDKVVLSAGGNTAEFEIIGITSFPFDQIFMEWRTLAALSGLTLGAPRPNEYHATAQVEGYAGSLPGEQVVVLGIDEQLGSFVSFVAGGNLVADAPGVIVSTAMAANGNYQVGDDITLAVGETNATCPIVGIFELPPGMASQDVPPDLVGMFWQELASLEGRDLEGGEPSPNSLLVEMDNSTPGSDEVDEVIDRITEVLLAKGITAEYTNNVKMAEDISNQIQSFGTIFTLAALVMAAVGAIGLLAALSMSVFERQKEIGVMRSIGAGAITIAGQFLVEGILIGFSAWMLGVPLSYLLSRGLVAAMGNMGSFEIPYPPISLVIGFVGMVVVATIASLWPSISAARKTVSEIIRYQ